MGRGDHAHETPANSEIDAGIIDKFALHTWAFHEAGHAVTAIALGLTLISVKIRPKLDLGSSANGITQTWRPLPDAAPMTFPPGSPLGRGLISPVLAWLTFLYAGGAAETRAMGQLNLVGRYGDRIDVLDWFSVLNLEQSTRVAHRDRAEIMAEEVVAAHWPIVANVAEVLASAAAMSAEEVEDHFVAQTSNVDWDALAARVDARHAAGDIPRSFTWAAFGEAAALPAALAAALAAMDDDSPDSDDRAAPHHAR